MTVEPPNRPQLPMPLPAPHAKLPEKLVCGYLLLVPLLWVLGLNLPIAFLVIFGTFAFFVRSRFAWSYALPWFLVGTTQIVSVMTNWFASNQPWWMLAKHFLASYVSGWFLLGAALGIGASGLIRPAKLLRTVSWLTLYTAMLAVPTYLLALVLSQDYMYVLTPLGRLMPNSLPSRAYSFGMFFYNWDEIAGVHMPRIALFYPWPTALGFAGVCTVLLMLSDDHRTRRGLVIACGVFMVFASLSRTAVISLIVCLAARWFLNWSWRLQSAAVFTAAAVILGMWLWGEPPQTVLANIEDGIEKSRPGAAQARNEVYEASWQGIRKAPLLGHGWPGEAVHDSNSVYGEDQNVLVIGSHSTISGLLYKGGALTFVAFLFAFSRTALGFLLAYRSPHAKNALALLVAVALVCTSEGLESLVFPTLFVFLWLGVGLVQSHISAREVA